MILKIISETAPYFFAYFKKYSNYGVYSNINNVVVKSAYEFVLN